MNNIYLIFIFLFYINCSLPNSGKFVIKKYTDNKYDNVTKVSLNDPSSSCWTTDYDNGIRPIDYNIYNKILKIKAFNVDSCYGTINQKKEIVCDDSEQNYTIDDINVYFKCSYVPYPSNANFTLNIYNDKDCLIQKGLALIKGTSNCWKINENFSMNPINFNFDNLEDLSFDYYSNGNCNENFKSINNFKCDGTCQNVDDNYFRCYYISGNFIKINLIYKLLIIFYLFL